MGFVIDKQFDFCYGHRVHLQKLSEKHSLGGLCKCRHLHGHNGVIKVQLQSGELHRSMVTDFKNLECLKVLIDEVLDHKFLIDIHDPVFQDIVSWKGLEVTEDDIIWDKYQFGKISESYIHEVRSYQNECQLSDEYLQSTIDRLEGFVFTKFCPTSEELCAHLAKVADMELADLFENQPNRPTVKAVEFWETPKSHCVYSL